MNKSEKLAKLLGIEPDCDCHGSCNLADKDKYCKCCKPLSMEYINFKKNCLNQPKPKYPDFIKPSNFVKLLELGTEGCTLWWKVNARAYLDGSGLPSSKEEFLEKLIRYALDDKETHLLAQQTEWEY